MRFEIPKTLVLVQPGVRLVTKGLPDVADAILKVICPAEEGLNRFAEIEPIPLDAALRVWRRGARTKRCCQVWQSTHTRRDRQGHAGR